MGHGFKSPEFDEEWKKKRPFSSWPKTLVGVKHKEPRNPWPFLAQITLTRS
jgi:hypothetical protein